MRSARLTALQPELRARGNEVRPYAVNRSAIYGGPGGDRPLGVRGTGASRHPGHLLLGRRNYESNPEPGRAPGPRVAGPQSRAGHGQRLRRPPTARRRLKPLGRGRLSRGPLLRLLEGIEAFLERLLVAAVARVVVSAVLDGVGEVLLVHLRFLVIVGVLVALAVADPPHQRGGRVAQMKWDRVCPSSFDVLLNVRIGGIQGVALGGRCQIDHALS